MFATLKEKRQTIVEYVGAIITHEEGFIREHAYDYVVMMKLMVVHAYDYVEMMKLMVVHAYDYVVMMKLMVVHAYD